MYEVHVPARRSKTGRSKVTRKWTLNPSFGKVLVVLCARAIVAPLGSYASSCDSNLSMNSWQIVSEEAAPSWDELASQLSSEDAFQMSDIDDWIRQCVRPFADLDLSIPSNMISNYDLFEKPSGLCMVHVNCAYEGCQGPFPGSWPPANTYNSSVYTDTGWKTSGSLALPDATVHPRHVGDVSSAIQFAGANKIGVSIKTSGHSYTGSSTKKGTLLLNLSKLQKYSPHGSIFECRTSTGTGTGTRTETGTGQFQYLEGAHQDSCNLAIARKKKAIIRVGGGEIWDEVLRAVAFDWNQHQSNSFVQTQKYHIVAGAAGTVSAAGGWLSGGGLSGTANMRSYGLGVDQVLHIEMVLPNGLHVRFGPTEWEDDDNSLYPLTKTVTGYYNRGNLSNEESWDWEESISDDIDFRDLWFAVRGGGGGAYGVITSIYYQLHDHSLLQLCDTRPSEHYLDLKSQGLAADDFFRKWIDFILRFFFDPHSIGVTEYASNSCSSPHHGGFLNGVIFCFNGAGEVMKSAWNLFYYNETDDDRGTDPSHSYFNITTVESNADLAIQGGKYVSLFSTHGVPQGRLYDSPPPSLANTFTGNIQFLMFPQDILVTKRNELISMFFDCMLKSGGCSGKMYIMGGAVPSAGDGLNAIPEYRRNGGFLMTITNHAWRTAFTRLFYDTSVEDTASGANFPGVFCQNHASLDNLTPLKEDWTQSCDPTWSKDEKANKCFSYQEAVWGSYILDKLENIHEAIDPYHLFNCNDCVGYSVRPPHNITTI